MLQTQINHRKGGEGKGTAGPRHDPRGEVTGPGEHPLARDSPVVPPPWRAHDPRRGGMLTAPARPPRRDTPLAPSHLGVPPGPGARDLERVWSVYSTKRNELIPPGLGPGPQAPGPRPRAPGPALAQTSLLAPARARAPAPAPGPGPGPLGLGPGPGPRPRALGLGPGFSAPGPGPRPRAKAPSTTVL